MVQLIECLPIKHEALASVPSTAWTGRAGAHLYLSMQEVDATESHPQLHMRSRLTTNKQIPKYPGRSPASKTEQQL